MPNEPKPIPLTYAKPRRRFPWKLDWIVVVELMLLAMIGLIAAQALFNRLW